MVKRKRKLILYELNEVPIKLLKLYSEIKPNSNIAFLLKSGNLKKTITKDKGELHPWSTWPTVHRGVNNEKHRIYFINQNLDQAKKWPPIWEKLVKKEVSIGIFGSLQSYPPFINKNTKFYLPDTFSPTPNSFPKELEIFQKFNLHIVNKNKALTRGFSLIDIKNFLKLLISKSIKLDSILRIVLHLIQESLFSRYRKRRSLMQAILSFDIYEKYLKKDLPEFSTFFTNHLAGMMHRYWNDIFSKDTHSKASLFNKNSIIEAIDISDNQIGKLLKITNSYNYDLLIISSMGQDKKDWGEYIPELYIGSINKLIKVLDLDVRKYKLLPAMQPDLCIECKDEKSKTALEQNIINIKSINGKSILPVRYKNKGLKLNISIQKSLSTVSQKFIILRGKKISLTTLGIDVIERDKGTGYHIKEGTLIFKGSKLNQILKNEEKIIDTTRIHNIILKFFNLL